ncbi:hypothetical protein [Mycobacteroides abscessus]|uniref:hypothetical protein n=1 Tax=Mycobacteroides abscessus TaxID=36809 RepID=UPI00031860E4|nr:hypothetical protein [Mycobacteroides abscessus]
MTKTPEKFTTTREFSDTLRWMRERVLKLSIAELADTDALNDPDLIVTWLHELETPDTVVTDSHVGVYAQGLYKAARFEADELVSALTVAHFGEVDFNQRAQEIARAQRKPGSGPLLLTFGADLNCGTDQEYPDRVYEVFGQSCSLLPAARPCLPYQEELNFARAATRLVSRRDGLALVRVQDLEHPELLGIQQRWRGEPMLYLGVDPHTQIRLLAVDPIQPVTSLAQGWQCAQDLGADMAERGPLAWAIVLAKLAGSRMDCAPILAWSTLDGRGPEGFLAALEQYVTDVAPDAVALAPAADLIWSAGRKYLVKWHSLYVQARNRIDMFFNGESWSSQHVKTPGRHVLKAPVAGQFAGDLVLVAYDDVELPEAPLVIGRSAPAVAVTPTSLQLTGSPLDLERLYWLPTGIGGRILVRTEHGGVWRPLQLAA